MKMEIWDLSFENFRVYGPDHPEHVDFEKVFPGGALYVVLPRDLLEQVIDQNAVSLDKDVISNDVSKTKWGRLKERLEGCSTVAPPWGLMSGEKLVIAQGKHRFQWAVVHDFEAISIVVNRDDAERLKTGYGIDAFPMEP